MLQYDLIVVSSEQFYISYLHLRGLNIIIEYKLRGILNFFNFHTTLS